MHGQRTRQDRTAVQLELFGAAYGASDRPAAPEFRNDRLMVDRGRQIKPRIVSSNSLSLAEHMERCGYDQADYQSDNCE